MCEKVLYKGGVVGGWGSCARGNRRERRSLFNECTSEGGGDLKGVEGWARIGEEVLEVLCLLPPPPPNPPEGLLADILTFSVTCG